MQQKVAEPAVASSGSSTFEGIFQRKPGGSFVDEGRFARGIYLVFIYRIWLNEMTEATRPKVP
jgi:hypothetical protein